MMIRQSILFILFALLSTSKHKYQEAKRITAPRRVDVMLFGQAAVGKTSIAERITTGNFREKTVATIGADHSIIKCTDDEGGMREFVLWDTAGQERFAQMSGLYYRRAEIAIVVYSVPCPKSLNAATESVRRLHDENQKIPAIIMVGAKADHDEGLYMGLPLTEIAAEFCQQHDLPHLLVSSKENTNIDVLIRWIIGQIEKIEAAEAHIASFEASRIQLDVDEDYVQRGEGRHVVLDDSCC